MRKPTDLEREHLRILQVIGDLAVSFYPYKDDDGIVDDRLVFALGQIAATAKVALTRFTSEYDCDID